MTTARSQGSPLPCPRCEGNGFTHVAAQRASKAAGRPEAIPAQDVTCALCRGTGKAPGWGQPMAGTAAPRVNRDAP